MVTRVGVDPSSQSPAQPIAITLSCGRTVDDPAGLLALSTHPIGSRLGPVTATDLEASLVASLPSPHASASPTITTRTVELCRAMMLDCLVGSESPQFTTVKLTQRFCRPER